MKRYEQYHIAFCTLCISILLPIIIIGMSTFNRESGTSVLYLAEHKQLLDDWTTRPYVDIMVTKSVDGCPEDYEPLFYRNWNGTYDVCID